MLKVDRLPASNADHVPERQLHGSHAQIAIALRSALVAGSATGQLNFSAGSQFGKIERDVTARGAFTSRSDPKRKLMKYIRPYNKTPRTVKWKYADPSRHISTQSVGTVPICRGHWSLTHLKGAVSDIFHLYRARSRRTQIKPSWI